MSPGVTVLAQGAQCWHLPRWHGRAWMPVLCPSQLRGGDPSIPCQKKQQNLVAEVSASLSELLHRPHCQQTFLLSPWAAGRALGMEWGGSGPCPALGVGARAVPCPGCGCQGRAMSSTVLPLPPCSGRVAKEVMESSAKIKREPPEIHR